MDRIAYKIVKLKAISTVVKNYEYTTTNGIEPWAERSIILSTY